MDTLRLIYTENKVAQEIVLSINVIAVNKN